MSFIDNFGMKCNQCGCIEYFDKLKDHFEEECRSCGKRMVVIFKMVPNKKRNRPNIEEIYTNGCEVVVGTL